MFVDFYPRLKLLFPAGAKSNYFSSGGVNYGEIWIFNHHVQKQYLSIYLYIYIYIYIETHMALSHLFPYGKLRFGRILVISLMKNRVWGIDVDFPMKLLGLCHYPFYSPSDLGSKSGYEDQR